MYKAKKTKEDEHKEEGQAIENGQNLYRNHTSIVFGQREFIINTLNSLRK